MIFRKNLKLLLQTHKMSNYALAKKLGTSESTIANWLNGVSSPKMESLIKMSEIFNISIDDMVKREI